MYFQRGYNTKKFIQYGSDQNKSTLNVARKYNMGLLSNISGSETL